MKADKNEIQTLSKEFEKRSFTTKSHQICSETQSTESQVDPVLVQSFPLLQYIPSRSETWHNPYLTAQKDHRKAQKQPLSESIQKEKDSSTANSKCSFAEKKPFYTQHFFTPGKLESMECVNDIQSILSTSPLYPPCVKNTDNMEQSLSNHLQSNKTIACAKNESIVSKQYARSQSALESTKHGKQEIISIGPKIDIHREQMLAKVNSQLYYKVPNDDKFYPVSENMMIPRHAQFFVQDNLTENYALLPSTKSVPSKKGIHTFHEDANSLKKSLNVLETPMEINEANRNDAMIERDYCEIKEDERSSTDISVEDRLSDTTFDSIIKASEVFIDKSKKIKHIISETKSAVEKATVEEIDEKLGDQLPDTESGASRKTEENICRSDDIDSSKTIVPSLGLIVERKNRRQNKSFKQVIAEKRAEKKRMQQVLSKKKFWDSAYMKKEQFNSSQDDQSDTQLDKTQTDLIDVKFLNHDSTDDNECPKQPLDNTAEVKHSERSVSSKFVIAYQPRPKSCAAKKTGRATKNALSCRNRTKTDPYDFYRKPSIDYTKKLNQDKNVYTSSSNYQQTSKPVTIFPRSMCARSHQQREADDCASKVLTALRRLSIEKSPKKDQQESPKKEVRQRKLRASVMRQLPRTPNQISDHKSNDHKRGASVSAINSDEYNEDSHSENVEEESSIHSNDDNCMGKIPVVISVRINQIEHIPESSKDDGFSKYGTTDQKENENEQRHTNVVFQQSEIQSPYSRYNQTTSKSDSNSNSQNKELGEEIDISLCNAREQTLIDSFSVRSSSSSISVDKQKYLGIPYFDATNSNMNNTKFMYPPFNCKTAPSYRVNQGNFLEQVIEQLPDVSSEQCDCYLETTNNGDVDVADKDGIGYQAVVPTEYDIITNENQQNFNFANEDYNLREVLKNTSKNNSTTDMQMCAGNGALNDEGIVPIVPNVSYVHNSMLDTESTEIFPDSCLDTEWLKMALMIDTEGNTDDNYYFATTEISKELVASEKEIKPDQIHNGSLTYFEYDIPPALQQQSNVELSETTNQISFSDGRNLSETIGKKTGHSLEILAENECFQHVCDTIPIQNVNISANNKNTDTVTSFLSQSGIPVTLMHYTDKETFNYDTDTELADSQGSEYTVSVINEDCDHYYQLDSQCNTLEMQEQPTQTMSFEGNNSNGSNSCDIFLDETECGQEVCIGDKEMSDKYEQDLERGIGDSYENEICCRIESTRYTSAENCCRGNNKNEGEKKDNINIDPNLIPKNNKLKNIYEKQTNEKGIECFLSKDSHKTSKAKGENQTDKKEMKKKRQNQKNKKTSTGNSKLKFSPAKERYSPSESEVEAYFNELEKRTEAEDPNLIVNKNGCSPQADDSLPDIKLELSKQTPCLKDKVRVENLKDDFSRKNVNLEKRVYTETLSDNENVIDDDNDDDNDDDDDDKDYNPDDDINDLYNSSETDSETEEDFANDSFAKSTSKMKKEKSKTETKTESSYNRNENTDKKRHVVSIEKLRKKFQKKYDIKNSSTINKMKQKSLNQKAGDSQQNTSSVNVGQNKCSKNLGKKEKSIVREFCSKKKETCYVHLENLISEKQPTPAKTRLADDRYVETSKSEEFDEREGKQNHNTEKLGSNSIAKCRKKKSKRKNKNISQGEGENTEDEKKGIAAEGFIKTQKLYYDILRKASVGAVKEDIKEHIEKRVEEPCAAEDLSEVIEAVPLHGERVITKALSDAEKALEGTGSLEDIHNDDNEGTVIEDLINQCSYQMIEDEDHIQLGGIAYFKDFTLPFVYVNGYKYTTLKDALTIFTPACCISACTIPRSVLQKYKVLVKSLTTWDQVYKLELIKLKKGPSIMTGDVLLKLDTFVVQLPEIIDKIFEQHIGTKLKRSKKCNISEYKSLKSKFM